MNSQSSIDKVPKPNCCQNNWVVYVLTPSLIVLLILGALTAGYFAFDKNNFFETTVSNETLVEENDNICGNAECVQAASQILGLIDETVDPCVDYYQFVCGNFLKTAYEIGIDNPFYNSHLKLLKQRDHLIIDPIDPKDPHLVQIQKQFFQSCLNEDQIEDNANWTFLNLTSISNSSSEKENVDWIDAMVDAKKRGLPFEWFLRVDLHEIDHHNLLITYPTNCSSFQSNATLMQHLDLEEGEIQNIISFEKKLLLICEKSKNEEVIEGTISDLENLWFRDGCLHFITTITEQNKKWRLDSKIVYHNYIVRLSHLLKSTPKTTQNEYIMWKVVEYFAPFLANPVRSAYLKSKNIGNQFAFCLEDTKQRFQYVSTGVQIQQFLLSNLDKKEKFVNTIINEMKNQVEQISWYQESQKRKNLEFYKTLKEIVGGLTAMADSTFFDTYLNLDQVNFSSNDIISMITELNKAVFQSKMAKIGTVAPQKNLVDHILKTNTLNQIAIQPEESALIVPSMVFNSVFYKENVPSYLNFAGLGLLIALELSHHFLELNRPLNESYQQATDNQYCFLDNLKKSKITVDPHSLFETNYVFLIAQDVAYKAYQNHIKEHQEEMPLCDLRYTPNQVFWIKSSQNWCITPDQNDHEVYKLRILESVKNSETFVNNFDCNYDSPMNPVKKCSVL